MLEHITGRAWEDLLRDRLFLPLGITTGGFGPPGAAGKRYCVVSMAPEIDFAVLVACNRGPDIAVWKIRQAGKALIRTFAPKHTG